MRRIRSQWRVVRDLTSLSILVESLRLRAIEADFAKRSKVVCVCSEVDQQVLRRRDPQAEIAVVPNTVSIPPLVPSPGIAERVRLLFVGTLDYVANDDGLMWFLDKIWPRITAALGPNGCRFTIVGRNPSARILAFADGSQVCFTGYVSDVAPYYANSDIVIAPIRFGGGTRLKILEAMSYGRPVVSTSIGAEGIPAEKSVHIEHSDTCDGFAATVVRLAKDPIARERIGAAGRKFVETKFSPEVSSLRWHEILEIVLGQMQTRRCSDFGPAAR
jgi:glycosyltransferase involved in cell wall biosynthesis